MSVYLEGCAWRDWASLDHYSVSAPLGELLLPTSRLSSRSPFLLLRTLAPICTSDSVIKQQYKSERHRSVSDSCRRMEQSSTDCGRALPLKCLFHRDEPARCMFFSTSVHTSAHIHVHTLIPMNAHTHTLPL